VIEQLEEGVETKAPDPTSFFFFKCLKDISSGGQVGAIMEEGLPKGFYRISSILGAANHQPVLLPVAQHGAVDDTVYFWVTDQGMTPIIPSVTNSTDSSNSTATLPDPTSLADSSPNPSLLSEVSSRNIGIISGVVLGGLLILSLLLGGLYYVHRRSRRPNDQMERRSSDLTPFDSQTLTSPPNIVYNTMKAKTNSAPPTFQPSPSKKKLGAGPPSLSRFVEGPFSPTEKRRSVETVVSVASAAPSYHSVAP